MGMEAPSHPRLKLARAQMKCKLLSIKTLFTHRAGQREKERNRGESLDGPGTAMSSTQGFTGCTLGVE